MRTSGEEGVIEVDGMAREAVMERSVCWTRELACAEKRHSFRTLIADSA
jgi:hypothetical protein